MFTINEIAHNAFECGKDNSGWTWMYFEDKHGVVTRALAAYRACKPFSAGVLTVYSLHQLIFDQNDEDQCPRVAFKQDLLWNIKT